MQECKISCHFSFRSMCDNLFPRSLHLHINWRYLPAKNASHIKEDAIPFEACLSFRCHIHIIKLKCEFFIEDCMRFFFFHLKIVWVLIYYYYIEFVIYAYLTFYVVYIQIESNWRIESFDSHFNVNFFRNSFIRFKCWLNEHKNNPKNHVTKLICVIGFFDESKNHFLFTMIRGDHCFTRSCTLDATQNLNKKKRIIKVMPRKEPV